jgi:hypothetical protein
LHAVKPRPFTKGDVGDHPSAVLEPVPGRGLRFAKVAYNAFGEKLRRGKDDALGTKASGEVSASDGHDVGFGTVVAGHDADVEGTESESKVRAKITGKALDQVGVAFGPSQDGLGFTAKAAKA